MTLIKGMNLLKLNLQLFATSSAMSTDNNYIKYKISVTPGTQSVTGNYTPVTVKVYVYRTNSGYTTYGKGTCYCKINGTTYSASITSSQKFTYNSNTVVFTKTLNIPHNADGTKTLVCSAWIDHSQFTSKEQSYSEVLTTIPRASSISSISGNTIGSQVTVNISRHSSSFTHKVFYTFGDSKNVVVGTGVGTSVSFTPSMNDCSYLPNETSGTATIKVETYSGSTLIGTASKTFTLNVPSSVKPSISNVAISEGNAEVVPSDWGVYVKNKSKLKFVISASGSYDSTISSIKTTINGSTYIGSEITTNLINTSGTLTATIVVTDSRNRTISTTKTISIVDYDVPYITNLSAFRCDKDGNALENGTYAKVSLSGGIYSLSGKNTPTYAIKYKTTSETEYQTYTFDVTDSTIDGYVILENIQTNSSYNIMAVITDYFNPDGISENMNPPLMSGFRTINHLPGGHGIAFGKMAEEEDTLDVAFATKLTGGLKPVFLAANTDLNDVRTPNFYTGENITNYNYLNCPLESGTFYLEVVSMGSEGQVRQRITSCSKDTSVTFERFYYNGGWGEWRDCLFGEEVLYDNPTGSREKITLAKAASQYKYIEIFYYYGGSYFSSVKVYNPNGKKVNMVGAMVNQSTLAVYFSATNATISGTTITPNYYGEYTVTSGSFAFTENRIFITRVVGYR